MSSRARKLWPTLAVVTAAAALMLATSAQAAIYIYQSSVVGPGGTAATPDPQEYRTYNYACRSGNSGQARARYYQGGSLIADSGVLYTHCEIGAYARNEQDGTYKAWCKHEGTVSWELVCQTTKP